MNAKWVPAYYPTGQIDHISIACNISAVISTGALPVRSGKFRKFMSSLLAAKRRREARRRFENQCVEQMFFWSGDQTFTIERR